MDFGRNRTKGKPAVQDLLVVCGSFHRSKYELHSQLEWLERNLTNFDPQVLECHYGLLLSGLSIRGATKLIAKILIRITNVNTITQSRVDRVCDVYEERGHPASIAKLLISMSRSGGPNVYVPPLGQKCLQDTLLPVSTVIQLANRPNYVSPETFIPKSLKINNQIYFRLTQPKPEEILEEELAMLIPYVEQCGRLPTSLELRIYDYLEHTWLKVHNQQFTAILYMVAAHMFRFWPPRDHSVLQSRLLSALQQAQPSIAEIIIPHLWHLGIVADSTHDILLASMVSKRVPASSDFTSIRTQSQVFLHYYMHASMTSPPPVFVSNLLIQQNVYLFLCSQWASLVPWIGSTLQGNFHLLPINSPAYKVIKWVLAGGTDYALSVIFDSGNSPWVADYPAIIRERAKAAKLASKLDSTLPSAIDNNQSEENEASLPPTKKASLETKEVLEHEAEEETGMSYPEYVHNLNDLVANADLDIMPYLAIPY